VHLKGVVDVDDTNPAYGNDCVFGYPEGSLIFTLPPGYRPAKREVHATLSNGELARINVDGPAAMWQPAGAVSVDYPAKSDNLGLWISLDGISFRCAPSGANGCP
jgi:hypothetical protein